jgi:anti-sigma factor RsiW
MNSACLDCNGSAFDIKAYALGESSAAERRELEPHLAQCPACRTELASLGLVHTALQMLPAEQPPRRIAFVSDKVFEPRWWQRLNWAQMLAPAALAALAALAVVKTQVPAAAARLASSAAGTPAPGVADAILNARVAAAIESAVAQRVEVAVKQAVADSESRAAQRTAELVQATERRMRADHNRTMAEAMAVVDANFDLMRRREATYLRASADLGSR